MAPGTHWARKSFLSFAIAGALILLLVILASLQNQWLGEVSRAEEERMRGNLQTSLARFAEDFNREITRAFFFFYLEPSVPSEGRADRLAERYSEWAQQAPYPDLIEDVFVVETARDETTLEGREASVSLNRLDPQGRTLSESRWPEDLIPLRDGLQDPAASQGSNVPRSPLLGDVPALAVPLIEFRRDRPPRGRRGGREWRREIFRSLRGASSFVLVRVNRSVVADKLVPDLVERYFVTQDGPVYRLAISAMSPEDVVFSSPGSSPMQIESADGAVSIFGLIPLRELSGLGLDLGPRGASQQRLPISLGRPTGPRGGPPPPPGVASSSFGQWKLAAWHQAGSLEAAVQQVKARNLAISLGILALLAAAILMMVASNQRAQRLARQQLEFVAGVSHELNTPLASIRSAAQNLSDGVVAGEEQIKQYGAMIEGQSRRLSELVTQVLDFAGLRSRNRVFSQESVDIAKVLESALCDLQNDIEARRAQVELDVSSSLSPIKGDASALRRALQNLISNALKYGGKSAWVGVRAWSHEGQVKVRVSDRGPGIAGAEVRRVFEPFYRGQDAVKGQIQGSGLGLSVVKRIVEDHGGNVSLSARPEGGTAFTISFPPVHASESHDDSITQPVHA